MKWHLAENSAHRTCWSANANIGSIVNFKNLSLIHFQWKWRFFKFGIEFNLAFPDEQILWTDFPVDDNGKTSECVPREPSLSRTHLIVCRCFVILKCHDLNIKLVNNDFRNRVPSVEELLVISYPIPLHCRKNGNTK